MGLEARNVNTPKETAKCVYHLVISEWFRGFECLKDKKILKTLVTD